MKTTGGNKDKNLRKTVGEAIDNLVANGTPRKDLAETGTILNSFSKGFGSDGGAAAVAAYPSLSGRKGETCCLYQSGMNKNHLLEGEYVEPYAGGAAIELNRTNRSGILNGGLIGGRQQIGQ